ncbi:MAG: peptidoglycan-binding protein [Gemmatimonadetes bacterium]|nr:peptidoglycan-binding protein [Gemmatimonadota bacterium]
MTWQTLRRTADREGTARAASPPKSATEPETAPAADPRAGGILQLQRTHGNAFVQRLRAEGDDRLLRKGKPREKTDEEKAEEAAQAALPHRLVLINEADPAKKQMSDAVAPSYRDFVAEVKELTGRDLGTGFGDTVRGLGGATEKVGADTVSWHKTARTVDVNQDLPWVLLDAPANGRQYFTLYLRHKDADAEEQPGLVTRFPKETKFYHNGDGGKVRKYPYVNVSAIAAKHGWTPIPAQPGWEKTYTKREWWHFENRGGNSWYQSLAEIYTERQIVAGIQGFAKGAAGANQYGARLQREGVPDDVLAKIFPKVKQGNLALHLPVGEGGANLADDVAAVQEALILAGHLAGPATGAMDPATLAAIRAFQASRKAAASGVIAVADPIHRALGAVKPAGESPKKPAAPKPPAKTPAAPPPPTVPATPSP